MPKRDPTGSVVRNALLLQRVGNGVRSEINALLQELFDELAAELVRIDPTGPSAERYKRQRIAALLDRVDDLTVEQYEVVRTLVRARLAQIGALQARWAMEQLKASVGSVEVRVGAGDFGVNLAKSILDTDPIHGELLKDWFEEASRATRVRLRREIQLGMAQNETLDAIVGRIRGDGGVLDVSRRGAESIARTSINDIANRAHEATWQANRDVTKKFRVVAALDARTTEICMSLDGTEWDHGDPAAPRFPKHVNCRTVTVPIPDWKGLGIDPPAEGTRASAGGPVPSSTTYSDWLRDQSAAEQSEILGATRARMFRDRQINLKDLVKSDGTVVHVADL